MTGPGWRTTNEPGAVQVVPEDDLILHVESTACPCAPKVEMIGFTCADHGGFPGKAAVRTMMVHNAMDGRL